VTISRIALAFSPFDPSFLPPSRRAPERRMGKVFALSRRPPPGPFFCLSPFGSGVLGRRSLQSPSFLSVDPPFAAFSTGCVLVFRTESIGNFKKQALCATFVPLFDFFSTAQLVGGLYAVWGPLRDFPPRPCLVNFSLYLFFSSFFFFFLPG